jgi:hypothetical protein
MNLFSKLKKLSVHFIIIGFVIFGSVISVNNVKLNNTLVSESKPDLEGWSQEEIEIFSNYNTISNIISSDKAQNIQIQYQIYGSDLIEDASINIRLSKGISIVSESIYDEFNQKEFRVNDRLYNITNQQLIYGPGTATLSTASLSAGDKGNIRFQINVADPSIKNYVIISYIRDNKGKIVQPSLLKLGT